MKKIALLLDPVSTLKPAKDTSLLLAYAAQQKGWHVYAGEPRHLCIQNEVVQGLFSPLSLTNDRHPTTGEEAWWSLRDFDCVLMRKDPPFDMRYIYATYLLELAQKQGAQVVNDPQAIRNHNEKLAILEFPQCIPNTLVAADIEQLRAFCTTVGDVICKPLDGMGGQSIFRIRAGDPNVSVILQTLTENGRTPIMVQNYLPAVKNGDKRIILVDGEPLAYCLARIPAQGETRANLAAGGHGVVQPLSERDRWIAQQVGPVLATRGLRFVGLDVIGEHLTEINVTSPTCLVEISQKAGDGIVADILERLVA